MREIRGLIPAIVQDFNSGRVLMLAYVNQESFDYMTEHGVPCFRSHLGSELSHKGAVSDNVQRIVSMVFGCDDDETLLIQVEQSGSGACHTVGSCFGDGHAVFSVMDEVYAIVDERRVTPQEKSYTNYLLSEGIDKVLKKVGEEAAEVIIAAKNGGREELVGEVSDLAYHLIVMLNMLGATPRDVRKKLAERQIVVGNLKK